MDISRKNYALRGLLIILVVFGHVINASALTPFSRTLYLAIYMFHMPLFMMLSGYYGYNLAAKDMSMIIKTAVTKLFVPFVIVSYTYRIYALVLFDVSFNKNIIISIPYAMWFLLALFVYSIISKYFTKFRYYLQLALIISIVGPLIASYLPQVAALSRIFGFMFFYFAGFKLRETSFDLSRISLPKILSVTLVVGLIGLALYAMQTDYKLYVKFAYRDVSEVLADISNITYYRLTILNIGLALTWSLVIYSYIKPSKFLEQIGKSSLYIYLGHIFFIVTLRNIGLKAALEGYNSVVIMLINIIISTLIIIIILQFEKLVKKLQSKRQ